MPFQVISNFDKINTEIWINFIQSHPNGNPFQTPQFFRFLKKTPGFAPLIITVWEDAKLEGLLLAHNQTDGNGLKGFFSKRTIVLGGPVIKSNKYIEVCSVLLKELKKQTNSIYTEFRNLFSLEKYQECFLNAGFRYNPHLNYIVPVPEEEPIQILNSSKRRQVKKSLKNGAKIITPRGQKDIKAFYIILKKLYKEKVKKPLPDWNFFESFYENDHLGKCILIQYKNRIIGGIICPIFNNTIYEWYVAGLDGKYKNIYPSVLATWAPIEYASKNGLKYFDFLGAGKPNEDYGVREFKSKFGGKLVEYGRYKKINQPVLYKIGEMGLKILQKIR